MPPFFIKQASEKCKHILGLLKGRNSFIQKECPFFSPLYASSPLVHRIWHLKNNPFLFEDDWKLPNWSQCCSKHISCSFWHTVQTLKSIDKQLFNLKIRLMWNIYIFHWLWLPILLWNSSNDTIFPLYLLEIKGKTHPKLHNLLQYCSLKGCITLSLGVHTFALTSWHIPNTQKRCWSLICLS